MLMRTIFTLLAILSLTINGTLVAAKPSFNLDAVQTSPHRGSPEDYRVEFFPVAPHYVGDVLSIRITYRGSQDIGDEKINLTWGKGSQSGEERSTFSPHSHTAVFYWTLDTSSFTPGVLNFLFEVPALQERWVSNLNLLPQPPGRTNAWAKVDTDCCTIHYLTQTDAEAALDDIQTTLENKTTVAVSQFFPEGVPDDNPLDEPLSFVLIPIVIGHGGFASDEAVLTYSARNWAGTNFDIVSHHEIIHVLDRRLNPGPRPSLLSEGLAVYLSGGHYHTGDAIQRTAALVALDMYIPILEITDDFYAAQHEISYMEAAGLVAYLVERWGWQAFIDFYFNLQGGPSHTSIISAGLEEYFSMDLAELESEFIAFLSTINPDEAVKQDVRLTVEVYDTLRRYQALVIPSAHIQSVWWPPVNVMRDEGIVGDYAKRENSPLNVIFENKLIEIHTGMDSKNYAKVEEELVEINQMLDTLQSSEGAVSHYQMGWPVPKYPPQRIKP
jgi:hypothetical protein